MVWNGAEPTEMIATCRTDCHLIVRPRGMLHGLIWNLKLDLPLSTPEEQRRHVQECQKASTKLIFTFVSH